MVGGFVCCNGVLGSRRGHSRNAWHIGAPLDDVAEVMLSAVVNQLHHTAVIGELEPQFGHCELLGDPTMHPQLILEHRCGRLDRGLDCAIEELGRMDVPPKQVDSNRCNPDGARGLAEMLDWEAAIVPVHRAHKRVPGIMRDALQNFVFRHIRLRPNDPGVQLRTHLTEVSMHNNAWCVRQLQRRVTRRMPRHLLLVFRSTLELLLKVCNLLKKIMEVAFNGHEHKGVAAIVDLESDIRFHRFLMLL
jgi:hypothetical protein